MGAVYRLKEVKQPRKPREVKREFVEQHEGTPFVVNMLCFVIGMAAIAVLLVLAGVLK